MNVVVVGGGLSGLATAHRVLELAPEAELTLLEARKRAGGILGTIERDGFVIETGPDSILRSKPAALRLAERLGLGERVIETHDSPRGAYVVCRGALERVPEGFSLMAPVDKAAFMTSSILSPQGRARALMEPLIPARGDDEGGEESMAAFVRRRFGDELFERLAQPLIGGIYGGDPDRLSLAATMPRFLELERQYGSVTGGMRAQREKASGARYGLFVAFEGGMQALVDGLLERVGERIRTEASVERIEEGWRVHTDDTTVAADAIVLAVPAWVSADLVEAHAPEVASELRQIPYGSAATVTFSWPRHQVPHPLDAFGFVVPSCEGSPVLAATFTSVKWPGRAPSGEVLIRVFVGGENAPDVSERDDETVTTNALEGVREWLGVRAKPRFSIVRRYDDAMPQYQLGHRARVDRIMNKTRRQLPGLFLASNAYRGVGIPDTIAAAESVAEELVEWARQ